MATDTSNRRQIERAAALRSMLAKKLANDLAAFVKKAWPVLHPTRPLVWSWHYDLLCEYLIAVKQRRIRRLIINVPPRTAKSTIATICFPSWVWASEPSHSFLSASYSLDLSTEHSVIRRSLLQSGWYRRMWGDKFSLSGDRNQVGQFMNDRRGQMIATSWIELSVRIEFKEFRVIPDALAPFDELAAASRAYVAQAALCPLVDQRDSNCAQTPAP